MAMRLSDMAALARAAPLFVQVQIESAELRDGAEDFGHRAALRGTVVRVFAGDASWLGRSVVCLLPVLCADDEPPPSGIIWSRWPDAQAARVLEGFLAPRPSRELDVVLGMGSLLDAPSDVPVLDYRATEATELGSAFDVSRPAFRWIWGFVALVACTASIAFWRQNNWQTFGGLHDVLSVGPLLLTGPGGLAALMLAARGMHRWLAWCARVGLLIVVPLAIDELVWDRVWLASYPARLVVHAAIVSALAVSCAPVARRKS